MKIDDEFKAALIQLTPKEKDKLILRYLRSTPKVAKKLYFELVDDRSADEVREEMEEWVRERVQVISHWEWGGPKHLKGGLYSIGTEINNHVRTTKDKYGEASLPLLMLLETFRLNHEDLKLSPNRDVSKLYVYIIARVFKIMALIQKMHEDYYLDFKDDLNKLGEYFSDNDLIMKTCIYNGFDVNWLLSSNIPIDIESIQKDLRKRGYLR